MSRRVLDLQTQKEIIERWLDTPGIPTDAHEKLVVMLAEVNDQMNCIVPGGSSVASASPNGEASVQRFLS